MKNCKTCKNFDNEYGYPGEDNGTCNRLSRNKYIVSDVRVGKFIEIGSNGVVDQIIVGENFGCILYDEIDNA